MTQSPAIDSAVQKAEEFEKKHYADQTSSGQAQELDASDFKKAAAQVADTVSDAAQSVKAAVVGEPKDKETAGAATAAGENKGVAASPAESHNSFFAQMKNVAVMMADKVMPEAHAAGRYGDDGKWQDAKDEAREGGHQFNQAARDAADALGNQSRRGAERAADKTQNFFDQTREAARGVGQETEDLARGAQDRIRRDWPGEQVRGAANEVEGLTERAKDRVVEDWRDLKRGTRQQLDEASATREYEARNAPVKEDKGFFGNLFGWGNGDASRAEDKAREAGEQARQKGRQAKEQARETKEQARGFFNSTADEAADKAQEGKEKARGFFNRAGDEANRLGDKAANKTNQLVDRVYETAEDTKRSVQDTLDQAEDYLKADLEPSNRVEAQLSQGLIPLDTQTVLRWRAREE